MASTSLEKHDPAVGPTGDGHGEVEHASHGHVVSYNPDAPSEEWGWHGSWRQFAPKGSRLLLWLMVAGIFLMLFGNHVSRVEDWYLAAFGVGMAVWLLRKDARIRAERKRKP